MKKKLSAFLALLSAALLTLYACRSDSLQDENTLFRAFTLDLFRQEVSAGTISLHYTLEHPENYDIQEPPLSLGTFETTGTAASAAAENTLALLKDFHYQKLSSENQLTYDVLTSYLETALSGTAYILYEEPLSPLTGIQAQLPILLCEFPVRSPEDLDLYLSLLEKIPDYFDSLIAFERTRSKEHLFMTSRNAEKIIEECASFTIPGDNHYLFSSFETKLKQIDNLTEAQKQAYRDRHRQVMYDFVFPSYDRLSAALSALKHTGTNDAGLCYYPDGKRYYEYIVRRDTGSSRTIPQLQTLTKAQINEDLSFMQAVLPSDDKETDTTLILDSADPESILSILQEKTAENFPLLPDVEVEVKYVQEEMEDFSSPAFYMVPALDHTDENVIYINEGHLPDDLTLFTTLAHEGYPGHLYQNVYYASTDPDPIRALLNFGGYTEGWATYAEMMSYYLSGLSKDAATLAQRNASVILGLYAMTDMGIHYDGWSLAETVSFFRSFGITDTDTIRQIYDLILADPGNYLKYYIGYVEFLELKKTAIQTWGDTFTQKRFHQTVLEAGPAPFAILAEAIQ